MKNLCDGQSNLNPKGVFPRLRHRYGRRRRQHLATAKITPLAPQLEDSIRFHAVCSAVIRQIFFGDGDGGAETDERAVILSRR